MCIENNMSRKFIIDSEATNIPSAEVLNNESHRLDVAVDSKNHDIYMEFTSRESLRDYALNLLHESEYGTGEVELYPLGSKEKQHVVNGVRLTNKSPRIFINFPNEKNT